MLILFGAIFSIFLPRDCSQVAGAYVWIAKNHFCNDEGKFDIQDEHECKVAAKERGLDAFNWVNSSYPKGCFYHVGRVWFNMPIVGRRHSLSSPICRNEDLESPLFRPFQCTDVEKSVPVSWRCDGYHDCGDGSDEQNCAYVVIGEN